MKVTFKASIIGVERNGDSNFILKFKTQDGKVIDAPIGAKEATSDVTLTLKALAGKDLKLSDKFTIEITKDPEE